MHRIGISPPGNLLIVVLRLAIRQVDDTQDGACGVERGDTVKLEIEVGVVGVVADYALGQTGAAIEGSDAPASPERSQPRSASKFSTKEVSSC